MNQLTYIIAYRKRKSIFIETIKLSLLGDEFPDDNLRETIEVEIYDEEFNLEDIIEKNFDLKTIKKRKFVTYVINYVQINDNRKRKSPKKVMFDQLNNDDLIHICIYFEAGKFYII